MRISDWSSDVCSSDLGVDQLLLVHLVPVRGPDLRRAVIEVVPRPFVVTRRRTAALARLGRVGIGDPGGLLLAGALAPQGFIPLVVLDAGAVVLRHPGSPRPTGSAGFPTRRSRQGSCRKIGRPASRALAVPAAPWQHAGPPTTEADETVRSEEHPSELQS